MLMENYHRTFFRILQIMKVPVMPSVHRYYAHIIIINCDDVKVLGVKVLQIYYIKQLQPLQAFMEY